MPFSESNRAGFSLKACQTVSQRGAGCGSYLGLADAVSHCKQQLPGLCPFGIDGTQQRRRVKSYRGRHSALRYAPILMLFRFFSFIFSFDRYDLYYLLRCYLVPCSQWPTDAGGKTKQNNKKICSYASAATLLGFKSTMKLNYRMHCEDYK